MFNYLFFFFVEIAQASFFFSSLEVFDCITSSRTQFHGTTCFSIISPLFNGIQKPSYITLFFSVEKCIVNYFYFFPYNLDILYIFNHLSWCLMVLSVHINKLYHPPRNCITWKTFGIYKDKLVFTSHNLTILSFGV